MENEITILRNMIRDESEAVAHYNDAADKVTNPALKKLLNDIRDEEKVHIGELEYALKKFFGVDDTQKKQEGEEEARELLAPFDRVNHAFQTVNSLHNKLFH